MAHHQTIFRARRNGSSSGQFVDRVSFNVDQTIDLLEASSARGRHPKVRRPANALLECMAQEQWRVTAGPHVGGRGDDTTRHLTIRVGPPGRPQYHVRLDARGHAFEITGGR